MKIKKFLLISLYILGVCTVHAQGYQGSPQFYISNTHKTADSVYTDLRIVLDDVKLKSRAMLTLTPVLVSHDGLHSHRFAPVYIGRRNRMLMWRRGQIEVSHMEGHNNGRTPKTISLTLQAPYDSWMRSAFLRMEEKVSGCAGCGLGENEYSISNTFLPQIYRPEYTAVYLVPEVEQVKIRSGRFTAYFNFVVNASELRRNFENNASEFERVDSVVRTVINNKDLTVQNVIIDGYASPEGSTSANLALSADRAFALVDYLRNTYCLPSKLFKVTGHGEDWNGLVRCVEESSLKYKDAVLDIIYNNQIESRKAKLLTLDSGSPYRYMLANFYPPLRRTEYTITYQVRPFSVEEARKQIKTNPGLLSLNEMYLVAKSYPEGTTEYNNAIETAALVFSREAVSRLNLAAMRLNSASYMNANIEDDLMKAPECAERENNLGVYYALSGQRNKARICFMKAASSLEVAKHNLQELTKEEETL